MKKHEMIFCIVNQGFSDVVMDAARSVGARGGTILHAKGTANAEAEKMFGIVIQPEKEIVMILVEATVKDAVLHALYQQAGLKTAGQGIAFSLPVDDVLGLSVAEPDKKADEAQPDSDKKDAVQNDKTADKSDKDVK